MAACCRGLSRVFYPLRQSPSLRIPKTTGRLPHIHRYVPDRAFSSTIFRRFPSPARYPSATSGAYVTSDPVLRTVIQTREPVLLYKEPPRRGYLLRVYGCAIVATGIGLFNFWWASHLPEEQPFFVPPVYLIIGFGFCAIGLHIFQRPVRRISALEVIPATMGGRLQLRVTGRKHPFSKLSVVTADIWDATISEKTNPMVSEMAEAKRAREQNISEGLENLSIIPRLWELAARWLEQKFTTFFLMNKFAMLQFGIANIEIDGIKWKLDCTGYLREDGKAIDRIIAEE